MSDQKLKIAVFIDFDNVEIGVKTTLGLQFDIGAVLEAVKERGEVVTKVAYGDWKRSGDYGRAMSNHAVRLVQRVMTPGGDKNGADINLALDALEMAFTHDHINAFVIVGGDSDFITLVEKLKQYDRKVFVVGGRAFTSQVMQKNCTEFIAYENIVPDRRGHRPERGDRPRVAMSAQPIEGSMPLVKRALKLLVDREVTPQLGLLKSTLLQLDSSFSERTYGCGSFREFADKLAEHGIVTLRHQGRSTLVELVDGPEAAPSAETAAHVAPDADDGAPEVAEPAGASGADEDAASGRAERPDGAPGGHGRRDLADVASLGEGVALVRRALAEAATPPRWPMYPRQFKQFLRAAAPSFDERKYGSIAELMRACQKDGLLKLERDRQGGLRVFAATGGARGSVPLGWSVMAGGQPMTADGSGEGPGMPDEMPPPRAVPDELLDDDIGNRVGGAADRTREALGGRQARAAAAVAEPGDVAAADDDAQPADLSEAQPVDAKPKPMPKRARKTAASKKTTRKTVSRGRKRSEPA